MSGIKKEDALDILRTLNAGIDPRTRLIIREVGPLDDPLVKSALEVAIEELEYACGEKRIPVPSSERKTSAKKTAQTKKGRPNAGRKWTAEDDRLLHSLCAQGLPLQRICSILRRRERGVTKRMNALNISMLTESDSTAGSEEQETFDENPD